MLVKKEIGLEYLLVSQDLIGRTVDANGMKTKDSGETARAFSTIITDKNPPIKNWVDEGPEFAGEFRKFCTAQGREV